jgi:hypothetical protein
MDLIKFEIEVIEYYSYSELRKAHEMLNKTLYISRDIKDIHITNGDILDAIEEEKIIVTACDNLDIVEKVMLDKESDVFNECDFNSYCLN